MRKDYNESNGAGKIEMWDPKSGGGEGEVRYKRRAPTAVIASAGKGPERCPEAKRGGSTRKRIGSRGADSGEPEGEGLHPQH